MRSPAFQFYPKDFLTDENVDVMTLEQRGAYITLLSKCWIEGSLPMDQTKLKAMCNHPSNWNSIWESLTPCFIENGQGRLINPRLEKERKKQEEWRTKSRRGGILSGKARREKASKGGSRVDQANDEPNMNSSSFVSGLQSSSSTASSKKKREVVTTVPATYIEISRYFLEKQKEQFPNESALNNSFESCVIDGAKKILLFHIKEKWGDIEIKKVLDWILDDSFWSRQIRTLGGIRIRKGGKGTPMKFENARASMEAPPAHETDLQRYERETDAKSQQ